METGSLQMISVVEASFSLGLEREHSGGYEWSLLFMATVKTEGGG